MGLFEISDEELYQEEIRRPLDEKIDIALSRIREYEPMALELSEHGYYVAFSGGKDSIVLERLFKMAGVKYAAWYNNVTIDPPELVRFIKDFYPEVQWNNPAMHLTRKMVEKSNGPPTRLARWCCEIYKEQGGNDCFKGIGVRGEESKGRKLNWSFLSSDRKTKNPIICPIVYWTDKDVWQFIRGHKMNYCSLYDEGFKRLGCIGCPIAGKEQQRREFARWPKYEVLWRKGVDDFFYKWKGVPRRDGDPRWFEKFSTSQELWDWWISGNPAKEKGDDCQGWLW